MLAPLEKPSLSALVEHRAEVRVGPVVYLAVGQVPRPLARLLEQLLLVASVVGVATKKSHPLPVQKAVVKRVLVHVAPVVFIAVLFPLPHALTAWLGVARFAVAVVHPLTAEAVAWVTVARLALRLDRPAVVEQFQSLSGVLEAARKQATPLAEFCASCARALALKPRVFYAQRLFIVIPLGIPLG